MVCCAHGFPSHSDPHSFDDSRHEAQREHANAGMVTTAVDLCIPQPG